MLCGSGFFSLSNALVSLCIFSLCRFENAIRRSTVPSVIVATMIEHATRGSHTSFSTFSVSNILIAHSFGFSGTLFFDIYPLNEWISLASEGDVITASLPEVRTTYPSAYSHSVFMSAAEAANMLSLLIEFPDRRFNTCPGNLILLSIV